MKKINILLIILFGISCSEVRNNQKAESKIQEADVLPDMSIFHLPSTWNTQDNQQIELKDLQGNILVMVMIYTSCQIACPRLVADMKNIESQIKKNIKDQVKLILVSIDPERDTPQRLKAFAIENEMDGDQWLFLQGTEESVRDFANVLAVKYKQISPMDFSHSNIISVFDQLGTLQHQQEGLGVDNKYTIAKIGELARVH